MAVAGDEIKSPGESDLSDTEMGDVAATNSSSKGRKRKRKSQRPAESVGTQDKKLKVLSKKQVLDALQNPKVIANPAFSETIGVSGSIQLARDDIQQLVGPLKTRTQFTEQFADADSDTEEPDYLLYTLRWKVLAQHHSNFLVTQNLPPKSLQAAPIPAKATQQPATTKPNALKSRASVTEKTDVSNRSSTDEPKQHISFFYVVVAILCSWMWIAAFPQPLDDRWASDVDFFPCHKAVQNFDLNSRHTVALCQNVPEGAKAHVEATGGSEGDKMMVYLDAGPLSPSTASSKKPIQKHDLELSVLGNTTVINVTFVNKNWASAITLDFTAKVFDPTRPDAPEGERPPPPKFFHLYMLQILPILLLGLVVCPVKELQQTTVVVRLRSVFYYTEAPSCSSLRNNRSNQGHLFYKILPPRCCSGATTVTDTDGALVAKFASVKSYCKPPSLQFQDPEGKKVVELHQISSTPIYQRVLLTTSTSTCEIGRASGIALWCNHEFEITLSGGTPMVCEKGPSKCCRPQDYYVKDADGNLVMKMIQFRSGEVLVEILSARDPSLVNFLLVAAAMKTSTSLSAV